MENELHITTRQIDKNALITLNGAVSSASAEDFEQSIQTVFSGNIYSIVIDLESVNLITSAGLRVILKTVKTCRQYGGHLKLIHVSKTLKEILDIIGIPFEIFPDLDSALK